MKRIILATIMCFPCLLLVSEGNTFVPNIIGIIYTAILVKLSYTSKGKMFCAKLLAEAKRIFG